MAHHSPGWGCSLRGGALNVNGDDESVVDELPRPGIFLRNVYLI